ncbi:MAG: DUF4338 domain-containing protein [Pseudomonadota bacterium]|nr:DUF4338 domain-containing protein [Pseudomonadota bacterium]
MNEYIATINGKKQPVDVHFVKRQITDNPTWHRTRLSQELCKIWGWSSPTGQLKDMACRKLLLKMERNSLIVLPKLRRISPNALRNNKIPKVSFSSSPIAADIRSLVPIHVVLVVERSADSRLFNWLLSEYHYLGFRNTVGSNVKYLIKTADGSPLACLLYSSAAWRTASRDQFIGWSNTAREINLKFLANNTRFLILPWIRVHNLATHILAKINKRISDDWLNKYGHPLFLLETFVEQQRFQGTCYQAGSWINTGQTTGRTRDDRHRKIKTAIKSVWLYPLTSRFQEKLQNEN